MHWPNKKSSRKEGVFKDPTNDTGKESEESLQCLKPLRLLKDQDSESGLWETAWQQVKQDIKWAPPAEWDFDSTRTSDQVNIIHLEAQARARESEDTQASFTTWSGKQHTYREVYDNVAKYADGFKALGDLIVQADPGYATIPWVKLLLNLDIFFTFANLVFRLSSALASTCVDFSENVY